MTTPAPGTGTTTTTLGDAVEVLDEVQPKRLPAYPAYRDSGVRWLAKSPKHLHVREVAA